MEPQGISATAVYLLLSAFLLFAVDGEMTGDLLFPDGHVGRYVLRAGEQTVTLRDADGVAVAEAEPSEYRPETFLVYPAGAQVPQPALLTPVRRAAFLNARVLEDDESAGSFTVPVDAAVVNLTPPATSAGDAAADTAAADGIRVTVYPETAYISYGGATVVVTRR